MTHDLDPRGLEAAKAAYNHAGRHWQAVPKAIAAYLAATEPEGGLDRIAVVVLPSGAAIGASFRTCNPDDQFARLERMAVLEAGVPGPFARQIVRCHLRRPEPVAEVVGRVD